MLMEIEKLKNRRVEMENETQMEIEKLKMRQAQKQMEMENRKLDFERWKIEANSKHQKEMKQLELDESRKAESHVESCR